MSPALQFIENYKASCTWYKCPIQLDVVYYVHRCLAVKSVDFNLNECSGIESKSDASINIYPIFNALRFNTYFRSVTLSNVPNRKDAISTLANTLKSVN